MFKALGSKLVPHSTSGDVGPIEVCANCLMFDLLIVTGVKHFSQTPFAMVAGKKVEEKYSGRIFETYKQVENRKSTQSISVFSGWVCIHTNVKTCIFVSL